MTREEIIEQLDSIVGTYEILLGNGVNSDILDVDDIVAIREAISALSDYDKMQEISLDLAFENDELINKSRWIPVSERLPEKNVWVLVTVEQNDNRYQEIMRRNVYTGEWTDNIDNYTNEITAWMPLPEVYKAEKGGEE